MTGRAEGAPSSSHSHREARDTLEFQVREVELGGEKRGGGKEEGKTDEDVVLMNSFSLFLHHSLHISLSLHPSISPFLSLFPSISPSLYLHLSHSVPPSFLLYLHLSFTPSLSLSLSPLLSLSRSLASFQLRCLKQKSSNYKLIMSIPDPDHFQIPSKQFQPPPPQPPNPLGNFPVFFFFCPSKFNKELLRVFEISEDG